MEAFFYPTKIMTNRGYLYAIVAFGIWGLVPLFWQYITHLNPINLLGHRILWGLLILVPFLFKKGPLKIFTKAVREKPVYLLASTILIATNWYTFVYATQAQKMVEASLGYFLNPLLNVIIGLLFFKEQITKIKILSFLLALIGVIFFALGRSGDIWISLTLAFSFALYGVIHKLSDNKGLEGLYIELVLLLLTFIPFLYFTGEFKPESIFEDRGFLVFLTGAVTITPLVFFTMAVKLIPYSSVGFIQYLAPLGQLSIGVLIFKEPLEGQSLISFILIWLALLIYTGAQLKRKPL